jgi:hypothetical protein
MANLTIFRKSANTNNFGQRGYWGINETTGEVFEFATYHDIAKGEKFSPELARNKGIEVSVLDAKGVVPKNKIKVFVSEITA